MGKGSDAPAAPDYNSLIPLQSRANKDVFNYVLNASRANQVTPFGSSTWTKAPQFDQAGYDAAMAKYSAGQASGAQNGRAMIGGTVDGEPAWTSLPAGMGGGGGPAPNREDFTSYNWTNNQTLSPEQQALYDKTTQSQLQQADLLNGAGGRVADSMSGPVDYSSVPGVQTSVAGTQGQISDLLSRLQSGNFQSSLADSAYNAATRYLTPQQNQQRSAMESRLAEQGFVPGTPGYEQAMGNMRRDQDMALAQARDSAVQQGFSSGNQIAQTSLGGLGQIAGQNLAQGNFANSAQAQALAQLLAKRQQPLNELNALRSGTQMTAPNLTGQFQTPGMTAPDLMGAANASYQGQLNSYNAGVAGDNALFGDLLGAGALFTGAGGLPGIAKLFGGK